MTYGELAEPFPPASASGWLRSASAAASGWRSTSKSAETVVASFGAPAQAPYSCRSTRCSSPSRWRTSCATATCACWSHRPSGCGAGAGAGRLPRPAHVSSSAAMPHRDAVQQASRASAWDDAAASAAPRPATASSTPTWRRSSTPRAAPASPRAWCCRTATWWPAPRAWRRYLENHAGDTLLAALPLSFDAGFSQLTTAFHAGARVVLLNYLLPRDVLKAVAARARHRPHRRAAAVDPARAAGVAGGDRRRTCAISPTPAGACRARR